MKDKRIRNLSLDKLAEWYETCYRFLDEKYKKNALVYECFEEENLKNKSIDERKILETGIYISTLLKRLINPDGIDRKALRIARYGSLQKVESTIIQIVNDNKEYFSADRNFSIGCFKVDVFGSNRVREHFREGIISFFLERYNIYQALKLSKMFYGYNFLKLVKILVLPRFLGTILGSAVVVLTAEEMWRFVQEISKSNISFFFFFIATLIFSLLYVVLLDMKVIVPELRMGQKLKRSIVVLTIGLFESTIISFFLFLIEDRYKFLQSVKVKLSLTFGFKFCLLMASLILLIAIIMNHFWQKETIPKPL